MAVSRMHLQLCTLGLARFDMAHVLQSTLVSPNCGHPAPEFIYPNFVIYKIQIFAGY